MIMIEYFLIYKFLILPSKLRFEANLSREDIARVQSTVKARDDFL